jgi:hypothetical protein
VSRIVSAAVLAGAYPMSHKWGDARCLVHAVELDEAMTPRRVLCGRVKLKSISDDRTQYDTDPVNCPSCKARMKGAP